MVLSSRDCAGDKKPKVREEKENSFIISALRAHTGGVGSEWGDGCHQ